MLAKLNNVLAIDVQFVLVAQLSDGVFTDCFQTTLYVVNFDRLAHLREFLDNVTDFVDH